MGESPLLRTSAMPLLGAIVAIGLVAPTWGSDAIYARNTPWRAALFSSSGGGQVQKKVPTKELIRTAVVKQRSGAVPIVMANKCSQNIRRCLQKWRPSRQKWRCVRVSRSTRMVLYRRFPFDPKHG